MNRINSILTAFTLLLCLCALCSGCAPGLGETFRIGAIESVSVSTKEATYSALRNSNIHFRLGEAIDLRNTPFVAHIDGRDLKPSEEPSSHALRIVENQFREVGLRPSIFEGPKIGLELLEWHVEIHPGFPSMYVEAKAQIRLKVDQTGKGEVYKAKFSAITTEQHPIGSAERIERVFARAMAHAAAEALKDSRFLEVLTSNL